MALRSRQLLNDTVRLQLLFKEGSPDGFVDA